MWVEILFFDTTLPPPAPLPNSVRGEAGAWAEFHGHVRTMEKNQKISALRYEIYDSMARQCLEKHLGEIAQKHGLLAARFWHRQGVVAAGEASVYAALAAPHRREAFAALAELMDRLKKDVPIWKAEALPA